MPFCFTTDYNLSPLSEGVMLDYGHAKYQMDPVAFSGEMIMKDSAKISPSNLDNTPLKCSHKANCSVHCVGK